MPVSSIGVVLFALLASASWGVADFAGGAASRRAPLLGVLLLTQTVGLLAATGLAGGSREAAMGGTDVAIAVGCGILGATGLFFLYGGLSTGRMGVVAPVAGVTAATIPTIGGLILQGVPSSVVMVGIVLAVVAVVLVSTSTDESSDRPSGLAWALASGVAMGSFAFLISRVSASQLFWPLVVIRAVEATVFLGAIVASRRPWRIPRPLWPAILGIGILDMAGNAFYLTSAHAGQLAIAAVLSSLYPVVTVILATVLLRERVTREHAVGILAAALAIALIAAGSPA